MPKPKITLSVAIRRGCPLVPATKNLCFRFDADGKDWSHHRAHLKPLLGCDALGTALVGLAGGPDAAIERVYGSDRSPLTILYDLYPELVELRRQCPDCTRKASWSAPVPMMLAGLLWHLQDQHDYSREQVADFLEGL